MIKMDECNTLKGVITNLKVKFPDKLPCSYEKDDMNIDILMGQQDVIRFLEGIDNILESKNK
jgi:hypothetical protein